MERSYDAGVGIDFFAAEHGVLSAAAPGVERSGDSLVRSLVEVSSSASVRFFMSYLAQIGVRLSGAVSGVRVGFRGRARCLVGRFLESPMYNIHKVTPTNQSPA